MGFGRVTGELNILAAVDLSCAVNVFTGTGEGCNESKMGFEVRLSAEQADKNAATRIVMPMKPFILISRGIQINY
jgi:hypothetical protein